MNWAAVRAHQGFERKALDNLERQGFRVLWLRFQERVVLRGRAATRVVSLFPPYLLVQVDEYWRSIKGTRGVAQLLMSGDEKPAVVRDSEVRRLARRIGEDGLVVPPPRFEQGNDITVTGGIWKGATGLFEGQSGAERCFVLLNMLGTAVRTDVDEAHLAAA